MAVFNMAHYPSISGKSFRINFFCKTSKVRVCPSQQRLTWLAGRLPVFVRLLAAGTQDLSLFIHS